MLLCQVSHGVQNICVPSILSIAIRNEKIKQVLKKATLDHATICRYHRTVKKSSESTGGDLAMKLGFIGCGNMAKAMLGGILKK